MPHKHQLYNIALQEAEDRWGKRMYGHVSGAGPRVCLIGSLLYAERALEMGLHTRGLSMSDDVVDELWSIIKRKPSFWLNPAIVMAATSRDRSSYHITFKQALVEEWNDSIFRTKRAVVKVLRQLKDKHYEGFLELENERLKREMAQKDTEIKKLKAQRNFWRSRWLRDQKIAVREQKLGELWLEFDTLNSQTSYNR